MGITINTITTGYYKKSRMILKGENSDNPVLINKGFMSKKEIPIDKTTIRKVNYEFLPNKECEIIIEWKDGKLSQAIIDDMMYKAILAKMS